MTPSWWRDRTVFVTGHTGFKGSWLVMLLERLGARVRGYSLAPPTEPSLFALAKLNEIVDTRSSDVRDLGALSEMLRRSEAEIVIHMAAQSLVRESYADAVGTFATNLMGTVNLLEAVRRAGEMVRAVVVVTTDKCYENHESPRGYREDERLGGYDPYSSSKACAELATSAYRRSFFDGSTTAIASARAGNVIGGGDWAKDRLIPDLVRAFVGGKKAVIRNPDSVRPWQFVLDPLCGYLDLAERLRDDGPEFAEAWNFGPGDEDAKPVRWIADRMSGAWADEAGWEASPGRHPHETAYLRLDATKAKERLEWRPRVDLETGLKWTGQWYKAWNRGEDMRAVSQRQIDQFLGGGLSGGGRESNLK
jgi:CDP-glucose 4,6-dehydratase